MPRRRGFTLVELLVVISIFALLIALLLPALGQAKAAAVQTLCLTRMRHATVALWLYTQDHRSSFPAFPTPLAPPPNHDQHQYGTWIPPLLRYVGLTPPINPGTGQPLTASDLSAYYPITSLLRDKEFEALQCPSEIYGLWAIGTSSYRHGFFAIQNGLRRHYNSPSEPLGGPYIPWKFDELQKPAKIWAFAEAGYITTVTGVGQIRTYGFTVIIPSPGADPRSSPQHDGRGISLSRLDTSAAFYPAQEQFVAPPDGPWEFGSAWAPVWITSGGGHWGPPSGLGFPNN